MVTYETLKTKYDNIDKNVLEERWNKLEAKAENNTITEDDQIEMNNIGFYLIQSEEDLYDDE